MGSAQSDLTRRTSEAEHGERSSAEIKRDVDRTRSDMDETIDAIVERLNPSAMMSGMLRSFTRNGSGPRRAGKQAAGAVSDAATAVGDVGEQILNKIRDNPVPAALIAVGAAWLLMSSDDQDEGGNGHQWSNRYGEPNAGWATDGAGESSSPSMVGQVTGGVSSAAHSVAEQAQSAGESIASGARQTMESISDSSQSMMRAARRGGRATRQTYSRAMEDYPLAVGGAALGVGLLCGLAIPETEAENELLGDTRDSLLAKGKQLATNVVEHGKQVASETMAEVQQDLSAEGLAPAEVATKAKRVAKRAVKTAQEKTGGSGDESSSQF